MNANDIIMLLQIYRGDTFAIDASYPDYRKHTLNNLLSYSLIEDQNSMSKAYSVTKRGQVFAEYVTNLPLPIQTWSMPSCD